MALLQLKPNNINNLSGVKDPRPQTKRRYFSNQELLQRFTVYMRRNELSIHTYESRQYDLKTYFEFLSSINQNTIYKLNGDTLSRYLCYLKNNNFTAQTQRIKLKSLKAFYNWLIKDSIIDKKNEIFNGFCVYSYISELKDSYIPERQEKKPSKIREEILPLLDRFLAYYLNKGYSPGGTKIYRNELKRFIIYLEENTHVESITDITKAILSEYQIYLHNIKQQSGNPYSVSSMQKKLVVVRRFFKFLVQHDYLEKDPSAIIELPRLERGLPTAIMNDKELNIIINGPDIKTERGLRDRTIMEVMYSTGMRIDELCHLKIEDISFEDGLVKITHAKGGIGFQRVVPIGKIALNFIQRYLKDSRPHLLSIRSDSGYLFLNNFGDRLRKGTFETYMKQYRLRLNIRTRLTPHSFRVTCATSMLRNGADVRYIQEQLGHRSLRSTQIYTRVYPKDLKKVHQKTHPREKATKINTQETP